MNPVLQILDIDPDRSVSFCQQRQLYLSEAKRIDPGNMVRP